MTPQATATYANRCNNFHRFGPSLVTMPSNDVPCAASVEERTRPVSSFGMKPFGTR